MNIQQFKIRLTQRELNRLDLMLSKFYLAKSASIHKISNSQIEVFLYDSEEQMITSRVFDNKHELLGYALAINETKQVIYVL